MKKNTVPGLEFEKSNDKHTKKPEKTNALFILRREEIERNNNHEKS